MASPLLFERTTRLRRALLPALLMTLAAPLIALSTSGSWEGLGLVPTGFGDPVFAKSLAASVAVAGAAGAAGFVLGWPLGVALALFELRGRRALLALACLALLVPPLLAATGYVMLAGGGASFIARLLRGPAAEVLAFAMLALALVALATAAALGRRSAGAFEAARVAHGNAGVRRIGRQSAWPIALAAAAAAGLIALGDPGPAQMTGSRSAASEILVSWAALYDERRAAGQVLALAWIAALVIAPLAILVAPRLGQAALAIGRPPPRLPPEAGWRIQDTMRAGLLVLLVGAPLAGLIAPLARDPALHGALETVRRTALGTAFVIAGAGTVATAIGFGLALFAGRDQRMRAVVLTVGLAIWCLPPAAIALGVGVLSKALPDALAALAQAGGAHVAALGLRTWPLAFLVLARATAELPRSRCEAATLGGCGALRYLGVLLVPQILPAMLVAWIGTGLLAAADAGTAILLGAPGRSTLVQAIYTIMANAPEAQVAALCATQVLLAAAGALTLALLHGWSGARRA
jgi:ABC-type Fe3+ transport system permease subunit